MTELGTWIINADQTSNFFSIEIYYETQARVNA